MTTQRLVTIGVLLVAALATGLWASFAGEALGAVLRVFHKLLALAFTIFFAISVFRAARAVESKAAFLASALILGLSVVALFVTGALMSPPRAIERAWLNLHRIASVLAAITATLAGRLLVLSRH